MSQDLYEHDPIERANADTRAELAEALHQLSTARAQLEEQHRRLEAAVVCELERDEARAALQKAQSNLWEDEADLLDAGYATVREVIAALRAAEKKIAALEGLFAAPSVREALRAAYNRNDQTLDDALLRACALALLNERPAEKVSR